MKRVTPISPREAEELAAARRRAGLSQNALAMELGVSEATISKMETCRSPIPPALRARIDDILRVTEQRGAVA